MLNEKSQETAQKAKAIYNGLLREKLEQSDIERYVAIEPASGDYFLADTYRDAIQLARSAHPDRISFAIRIGHPTTVHIGVLD